MHNRWIVVADASRARIFSMRGLWGELHEQHALVHPESRRHEGDLRTGGKGEIVKTVKGGSLHQTDPETGTDEKHAGLFAADIAEFLRKHRLDGDYERLLLVAEPNMLGRLREKLDSSTAKLVEGSVAKNLARHERVQIQESLKN